MFWFTVPLALLVGHAVAVNNHARSYMTVAGEFVPIAEESRKTQSAAGPIVAQFNAVGGMTSAAFSDKLAFSPKSVSNRSQRGSLTSAPHGVSAAQLSLTRSSPSTRHKVETASMMRKAKEAKAVPASNFPNTGTGHLTDDHLHASEKLHLEKEKQPLSPAAQIIIGVATMFFVWGVITYLRSRCSSVVPRGANSERLDVVLQETMEKVTTLNAKLEQMYAELDEQDEDAINTSAAEFQERLDARNREMHEAAEKFASQKEKLLAKAVHARDAMSEAVSNTRERVEDFGRVEANQMYAKVQDAVAEREIPSWEAPEWLSSGDEGDRLFTIPPLMQLVAGAFAPSQLRYLRYSAEWARLLDLLMVAGTVVAYVVDRNKPCRDRLVWIWQYGLFAVLTLDFLCQCVVIYWSRVQIRQLRAKRQELDKADDSGSIGIPLLDTLAKIRRGGLSYFEAYFRYHSVCDSWLYGFTRFLLVVVVSWGGFGLYITIQDIIMDTLACDAKVALLYQHAYSLCYVIFLSWNVIAVLLWLTSNISSTSAVSRPFMLLGKAVDDDSFRGLPVLLTLVKSFVLNNSSEALGLTEQQVRDEVRNLNEQIRELDDKFRSKTRSLERFKAMQSQTETEAAFMDRCQRKVADALDQAKPFVGLVAANLNTQTSSGFHGHASTIGEQKQSLDDRGRASPYTIHTDLAGQPEDDESDVERF